MEDKRFGIKRVKRHRARVLAGIEWGQEAAVLPAATVRVMCVDWRGRDT